MGRIADALRRAEEERRLAIDGDPSPAAAPGSGIQVPGPLGSLLQPSIPADPAAAGEEPVTLRPGMSESLVPYYERSSLISEQYRALRTRLLSQNPQYEHRILAITSGAPKEGKSVTTLNLGCTLAEIRHLKVLCVDGDFRRGSLARMLNQSAGPGLAEVLAGTANYEDVIRRTPVGNLHFIAAGHTGDRSAAELLTSPKTRSLFRRFRNDFHYTIIDTPPATTVTDVGIIGQMCDGVMVIVRIHQTHEVLAKRAVRLLQVNNIPIMGVLAIGREGGTGKYGYGYGYGRYYNRYNEYYKKPKSSS